MTHSRKHLRLALPAALLAAWACSASASELSPAAPSLFGFTPRVPVSAFATPANWFDPSQLHLSTSVSVGSGFGGGADALQVTSLSYQFRAPVWMRVNVGNAWGASTAGKSSMFLEGVDLGMRPFGNFQIQVHYRDFRSPLQYGLFNRPTGWDE